MKNVGLSMMLDKEGRDRLERRKPVQGLHGSRVGSTESSGELSVKVVEGEETAVCIEELLILTMGALDLAVVPWSVGTNEFVANAKFIGGVGK